LDREGAVESRESVADLDESDFEPRESIIDLDESGFEPRESIIDLESGFVVTWVDSFMAACRPFI
jgi:hypothetical protein